MSDIKQYDNDYENKWCPGCGNFGILNAIKRSLADMRIPPGPNWPIIQFLSRIYLLATALVPWYFFWYLRDDSYYNITKEIHICAKSPI